MITRPNHRPFKELEAPQGLTELYYTIDETAAILKVHPNTIRKMIREGRLKSQRVGRNHRISREDIENM